MRARVLFAVFATVAAVGCGPEPATPTGEPGNPTDGAGTAKLEGIWIATKVDVPEGIAPLPQGELEKLVAMVKENQVAIRMGIYGERKFLVIATEDTNTPTLHVAFEPEETWDITAKKGITFHTSGQKAGTAGPRPHVWGLLKVVGQTATVAVSADPEGPSDGAAMIVFHLKRVKDLPPLPPQPPPQRPTFPSNDPNRSTGD